MDCKQCTHPINVKTDCYTVCEGSCWGSFHARCVGLTETTVNALKKNVIWLCDDCLAAFQRSVQAQCFQEPNESKREPTHCGPVEEMRTEINELKVQIANITAMLLERQDNSSLATTPQSIPLAKCSTPLSTSKVLNEVQEIRDSQSSASQTSSSNRQQPFYLHLSNVDNRVTEQDIDLLVSTSLGFTEEDVVNVIKLVPKGKSCEELEYISFKVVLDEKWRSAAMNASTWPRTIKHREFINRRRNTWYPSN